MGTNNLIFHKDLTGEDLHLPGYVQDNDPGSVGYGKLWIDTNLGLLSWTMKFRNAANTQWVPLNILWGQVAGNIANQTDLTNYIQTQINNYHDTLANVLNAGNDANGNRITNLGTPTSNADAVTKLYVDSAVGAIQQMVYPAIGVPYSTGSAWGASYAVGNSANNLLQLTGTGAIPTVNQPFNLFFEATSSQNANVFVIRETITGASFIIINAGTNGAGLLGDILLNPGGMTTDTIIYGSGNSAGFFLDATNNILYLGSPSGPVIPVVINQFGTDTSGESTTTTHGLLPKLDGVATHYLNGLGQWATVDSMVYPSAGLAKSTGSGWATSIADNSANWNTAYGWGNHAGLYSLLNHTHNDIYYTKSQIANFLNAKADVVHSHTLDALYDVLVNSGLSSGQVLVWNASAGVWINRLLGLHDLHDVNADNPQNNYVLTYDLASGKWIPKPSQGGSSGGGSWGSITGIITDQTDLIAFLSNNYSPYVHAHDDRYFTKTETSTLLSNKSDLIHAHSLDSLTDVLVSSGIADRQVLMYNSAAGVWHNAPITGFSLVNHTHTSGQLSLAFINLTDVPNSYGSNAGKGLRVNPSANGLEFYTIVDVAAAWGNITGTLSNQTDLISYLSATYALLNHLHDDRYFTKPQITTLLSNKADNLHSHTLDSLYDVVVNSGLSSGQSLIWNASASVWINKLLGLHDLGDVNTDGAVNNYVLTYDSGAGKWIPKPSQGGSSGSVSWGSIIGSLSSQTDLITYLDNNFAVLIHTHNDIYYTKPQITTLLSNKADVLHSHTLDSLLDVLVNSGLADRQVLMWNAAAGVWHNAPITGYALTNHSHTAGQLSLAFINLTDTPNSYGSSGGKGVRVNAGATGLEFYTIVDTGAIWGNITGTLSNQTDLIDYLVANYSAISHTHNDIYFTKTQVSTFLNAKADVIHTHTLDSLTDVIVNSGVSDRNVLMWNAAAGIWHNAPITGFALTNHTHNAGQISLSFLNLTDVPNSYSANKYVRVNATGTGLIFDVANPIYTGTSSQFIKGDGSLDSTVYANVMGSPSTNRMVLWWDADTIYASSALGVNGSDLQNSSGGFIAQTRVQVGTNTAAGGSVDWYSEQGVTDYIAKISTNANLTANYTMYLPVSLPAGTSILTVTATGQMVFSTALSLDSLTVSGAITGGNVTSGTDPGHTHTIGSIPHTHTLDSLSDVGVTSGLSSGQLLTYDSVKGWWVNWTPNFASGNHTHSFAFKNLNDVPAFYTGKAGLFVRVKASEDGLEFASAGSTGANTSLSNLTNPTAINQDLIFSAGATRNIQISAQTTLNGNGNDLCIYAGTGNGLGNGGSVTVYGGNSFSGVGGDCFLVSGTGDTKGGDVYIYTGGGTSSGIIYIGAPGILYIMNPSYRSAILDVTNISSTDKTFDFPNKSGTFALLSDITGATWGSITGTLSNQSDLQNALDAKYSSTNPNGYQTLAQVNALLVNKSNIDHTHSLDSLNDVGVTSGLANGQILRYDSTKGWWINDTIVHNDLTGIQGGAGNQNYHLSLTEYNNITGNSYYLKLNQSIPQTISNGRPISNDGIQFGTNPTVGSFSEGKLYHDALWRTLSYESGRDVTLQIGQEEWCRVYNNTGVQINNGQVVYTDGVWNSSLPYVATVALADASNSSKWQALGVATQDIPNGAYGFITVRGHVNGINTNSWTAGDILYLSDVTPGALTTSLPSPGNYKVRMGRVIYKDATNGVVNIRLITQARLDDLSNVAINSAALDEIIRFNGTEWVNGAPVSASASVGIEFFNATPIITATGTNNATLIATLSKTPITTAEQTNTISCTNNTVLGSAWLYDTALGRTSIDAGVWDFDIFAAVSSTAGGRVSTVTRQVYSVLTADGGAYTVSITGSSTSRTATASGGTPFATTKIDASATNTTASYLQTPLGLYQITARTSDTEVTIATPSGYSNESNVTFNVWKKLFGVTSPTITSTGTNYSLWAVSTAQSAFVITKSHKLGAMTFGTSNNTTTITLTYNGSSRNSHFSTPLITLHGNLAGLQGGSGSVPTEEYYHLTAAEYSFVQNIVGTYASHIHDDRYFTKTVTSSLLDAKANVIHAHSLDSLTDVVVNSGLVDRQVVMWNASSGVWHNAPITGFALTNHTHAAGQLTLAFLNLTDAPNSYSGNAGKGVRVNTGATGLEFYTIVDTGAIWGNITGTLSNQTDLINYLTATYSVLSHTHDDRYFTKTAVSTLLNAKADTIHNHSLDSLSDVVVNSGLASAQVLVWNSAAAVWTNRKLALHDLSDVFDDGPVNNYVLTYESATSKWIPKPAQGGITSVAWGSITGTLSAQTDLTAYIMVNYAGISHTHDDRYFTKTQASTLLSNKADVNHSHTLDALYDVVVNSGLASGQVLTWNASAGVWYNRLMGLHDLHDVNVDNPINNYVLTYDSNSSKWLPKPSQGGSVGSSSWGSITGDITTQTDLMNYFSNQTAPLVHTHDDRYYTKTQEMAFLNAKADVNHSHTLDSLYDVVVNSGLASGQSLIWNATAGVWMNKALRLLDLADVNVDGPQNNDVLTYETASGKWRHKPSQGGGGAGTDYYAQTSFTTQTSVVLVHGFGRKPLVQVISDDASPVVLIPDTIVHDSVNQVTVTFSVATSGTITVVG